MLNIYKNDLVFGIKLVLGTKTDHLSSIIFTVSNFLHLIIINLYSPSSCADFLYCLRKKCRYMFSGIRSIVSTVLHEVE